ncbi:MAG: hypothetical protein DMG80_18125 [Acidobacteria bacterium]|nr:MAG: hypothetical protein DMG80_18125 [Acidobacteriota bacterium]
MLIDHTHRKWFLGSAAALTVAAAVYVPYALHSPQGPRGGSGIGLTFGTTGFLCMLFAGLLGLRKKFPIWRIGRAQTWMRGHLWLGLLSFPLILFHGGFHFGGSLTRLLMWLFGFVWISGILGAALQHFMPRFQTAQLPMETIYEQIDRVRGQLAEEAGQLVEETCSALEGEVSRASERQRAVSASAGTQGGLTVASGLRTNQQVSVQLRTFLDQEMRPYLERAGAHTARLGQSGQAQKMFQQFRVLLPPDLHSNLDDLENICEEKRQLDKQSRLHRILHGWLLVHIPLSYGLLVLGAVHAVVALRF